MFFGTVASDLAVVLVGVNLLLRVLDFLDSYLLFTGVIEKEAVDVFVVIPAEYWRIAMVRSWGIGVFLAVVWVKEVLVELGGRNEFPAASTLDFHGGVDHFL